jgi:hypothetical protein
VFTFLIGVFFLFPFIERRATDAWHRWRSRNARTSLGEPTSVVRRWFDSARRALAVPLVRYSLVLMGASIGAYVVLFFFMNVWGSHLLGVPAPYLTPGVSGIFYDNSSPAAQSIGTILHSPQTIHTAEFWLILYALTAFIPLLSPRALILSVPWIGWTFLTDTGRYVEIGSQYTLVAAAPIFLGLAYGMMRVPIGGSLASPASADAPSSGRFRQPGHGVARRRRPKVTRAVWVTGLTIVIGANLLLMPINPLLTDLNVGLPNPFQTGYQEHSLEVEPGLTWASRLASLVPPGATVTAPSQVYALVANDPHAYVLLGRNAENTTDRLPFNVSAGPDFVLLPASFVASLGKNLSGNLSDAQDYGLRGFVGVTAAGPLLLYERGYVGPGIEYGPPLPPTSSVNYPTEGISIGKIAEVQLSSAAPDGKVIVTRPGAHRTGEIWSGPDLVLSPGTYSIRILVNATGLNRTTMANTPILDVQVAGFGAQLVNVSVSGSSLPVGEWTNLTFNVSTSDPIPELNVAGFLADGKVTVAVAALSIVPVQT